VTPRRDDRPDQLSYTPAGTTGPAAIRRVRAWRLASRQWGDSPI